MKLTKTIRIEILTKVLKEVFDRKFSDLQKRMVEYGRQWLLENHPVFVELMAHKDARQYLQTRYFYRICIDGMTLCYPVYGDSFTGANIRLDEISIPGIINDGLELRDPEIIKIYYDLHDAYNAAYSELHRVVFSYSTCEELLADFPEYSKYISGKVVAALPAIIPEQSRAKLTALGIPASE